MPEQKVRLEMPLVVVADVLCWRAMEKAGNRLRGRRKELADVPAHLVHTKVACDRERAWRILGGAWDNLPVILAEHGPHPVTDPTVAYWLTEYLADLLVAGVPHEAKLVRSMIHGRLGIKEPADG